MFAMGDWYQIPSTVSVYDTLWCTVVCVMCYSTVCDVLQIGCTINI